MDSKHPTSSTAAHSWTSPFVNIGQEQAEAAIALQKESLEAYEKISDTWLARVQAELALWSELATKLTASRSISEVLQACTQCVSQRIKMTADDGQHLFNDSQQITLKMTRSLANGWPNRYR